MPDRVTCVCKTPKGEAGMNPYVFIGALVAAGLASSVGTFLITEKVFGGASPARAARPSAILRRYAYR